MLSPVTTKRSASASRDGYGFEAGSGDHRCSACGARRFAASVATAAASVRRLVTTSREPRRPSASVLAARPRRAAAAASTVNGSPRPPTSTTRKMGGPRCHRIRYDAGPEATRGDDAGAVRETVPPGGHHQVEPRERRAAAELHESGRVAVLLPDPARDRHAPPTDGDDEIGPRRAERVAALAVETGERRAEANVPAAEAPVVGETPHVVRPAERLGHREALLVVAGLVAEEHPDPRRGLGGGPRRRDRVPTHAASTSSR